MNKTLLLLALSPLFPFASASAQTLAERNYPPSVTTVRVDSTNLPLVWITTTDTLSRYVRSLGHMKVISNVDGINYGDTVAHPGQTVEYDGPISIKWRGASSFGKNGTRSKKPMSVKTLKSTDISGKKDKVKLLGMGKDNDWCFLAPWQDRSYIRDVLTMQMARGGSAFAPQMRYCEVFLDSIYYGVYILSERATGGSKRLNLWDYGEDGDGNPLEDTTGDFHVEVDHPYNTFSLEKDPHYVSKHHPARIDGSDIEDRYIHYQYKDPEEEDFANLPGAREAVHKAIDDMEDAFASDNYGDLYENYIDVESFMDYEIAQEVANNIDAYRQSTPMWKYSDTHAAALGDNARWKLALWDFNLAYRTDKGDPCQPARVDWRYTANDILYNETLQKELLNPFYWQRLMADEKYVNGIKARYTQRRRYDYSETRIDALVDSLYEVLNQGAVVRNNKAWKISSNLKTNIDAVREFIASRMAWMDARWYITDSIGATLYFDNSDTRWEHVYVYSWLNDSTENAPWPGIELREKDYETATGGYYKAVVPYSNVIFNDGSTSHQTPACLAMDGHIYSHVDGKASTGLSAYVSTCNSLFFPSFNNVDGDNVVKNVSGSLNCERLVLSDGSAYTNNATFHADEVQYCRTHSSSRWGTIVLPFDVKSNEDVQYYTLHSVSDQIMAFEKVDSLAGGTPGVFKLLVDTMTSLTINIKDAVIQGHGEIVPAFPVPGWTMQGTYQDLEDMVSSSYMQIYFIAQDHFWEALDPISISPFRGWFESVPGTAPAKLRIEEISDTDMIEVVDLVDNSSSTRTDLFGRPLSSAAGLIIENGKIIFNKR